MSTLHYPLTFAAAKRAEKSQWAIGDALLEEIGPPHAGRRQEEAFEECARELKEQGMPYSTQWLRELRNTAHAFHLESRASGLSIKVAQVAGTPAVLAKAEELATEEGVKVSKRFVEKVRKASKKQERKAKGKPAAPARDKSRVSPKSTTALRREIDVADIELMASKAAKLGRSFAEAIAGVELSASEKKDLRADIDQVLTTWETVREALDHPLSQEAEDYLKAVS